MSSTLRITAWNCRQAFARKASMLDRLMADVAVIPESGRGIASVEGARWLQLRADDNRGLGVIATAPWTVTPDHPEDGGPLVVPCRVDGPRPFRLLAVWTTPVGGGAAKYVRPLLDALPTDGANLVVAGDFNASAGLEGSHGRAFGPLADALDALGLVSAWHAVHGVPFGAEEHATHRHSRGGEWHLDYVWLPRDWLPAVRSAEIGAASEWMGPGGSDHCPVSVEIDLKRLPEPGST